MAIREHETERRSFIGREQELRQLDLLRNAGQRLISLVAPGGYGKSRLASVWLEQLMKRDGVMCHEMRLASLKDPQRIPKATAEVIGLEPHENDDPWQQVIEFCRAQPAMVMHFDNFEHLLVGRTYISELLEQTGNLLVLVTSREPLGLPNEHVELLDALPLSGQPSATFEEGIPPAVALFADRARLAVSDFMARPGNLEQLNRLCAILDGVPLAIELAAAWTDEFSLEELERELLHHHDLQARDSGVPERHRSVRASCSWSYSLLDSNQQLTVRCLAAFHGGFSPEAAHAVLPSMDLGEVVDSLVSKCWLKSVPGPGRERYNFSNEAIREFAFQQLLDSDDFDVVTRAHCRHFAMLLEEQARRLYGPDQADALELLDQERDNLHHAIETAFYRDLPEEQQALASHLQEYMLRVGAARQCVEDYQLILDHAADKGGPQLAILADLALGRAYVELGEYDNARSHCMSVLERGVEGTPGMTTIVQYTLGDLDRLTGNHTGARYHFNLSRESALASGDKPGLTRALFGLAKVSETESRFSEAGELLASCLAQFREMGDTQGIAMVLNSLGNMAYRQGSYDEAQALHNEALELRRRLADRRGIAQTLNNIGNVEFGRQNFSDAWTLYSQSLDLRREIGDRFGMAASLNNLGNVEYCQNNFDEAARLHTEGLQMKRRIGDYLGCSFSLNNLGNIAYRQQDWQGARKYLDEAIRIARDVGSVECILAPLAICCALLAKLGELRRACVLDAGIRQHLSQTGIALDPMDGGVFGEAESLITKKLPVDELQQLDAEGSGMNLAQLAGYGLQCLADI